MITRGNTPFWSPIRRASSKANTFFKQGDSAKTLIITLSGLVNLLAVKAGKEFPVTYIESGSFLGEQSLVNRDKNWRTFSAIAATKIQYLELDQDAIEKMEEKQPLLLADILRETLRMSLERLNRSNRLLNLLRSTNSTERLIHLLVHFSQTQSRIVPEGREIVLSPTTVQYYIDIKEDEIDKDLQKLIHKKILIKKAENVYVIRNEKALVDQITSLVEALPPLPVI